MAIEPSRAHTASAELSECEELCLFYTPGSWSRVVMIVLEESGAQYRTRRVVDNDEEQYPPAFLLAHPKVAVPALKTSVGILTESAAIIAFLAGRYPKAGILPSDGGGNRSRALADVEWFASTLRPLLALSFYPERFCDKADAAPRIRALTAYKLATQMDVAEQRLARAEWFDGRTWSAADACLYWCWGRGLGEGLAPSRYPHVAAHHTRMRQRDSVQRAQQRELYG